MAELSNYANPKAKIVVDLQLILSVLVATRCLFLLLYAVHTISFRYDEMQTIVTDDCGVCP